MENKYIKKKLSNCIFLESNECFAYLDVKRLSVPTWTFRGLGRDFWFAFTFQGHFLARA